MSKKALLFAAAPITALALAGAAAAHVTVHPNALPSGGFTVINVRVPNERDTAKTKKIDVQLPAGFIFVSTQPVPGWKATIIYRNLAKPVTVFGEKHTQEVGRVVWTSAIGIGKGEFVEFPLSVAIPSAKAGTVLTFKALQTYSNGEVVRWIGSPSADDPAPQVKIVGANQPVMDYPSGISSIKNTMRMTQGAFGLPRLNGRA